MNFASTELMPHSTADNEHEINNKFAGAIIFLLLLLLPVVGMPATTNDSAPLDFAFIKTPPGKLVYIGTHRLHVTCQGEGDITILLEAGLGGSSMEWQSVQNKLPENIRSCAYDRAGYAWSDQSPYSSRNASQLAREAHLLLNELDTKGPLVLVGHSFGGFIVRLLADLRAQHVIGMILVDSSHENQIRQYEQLGGASPMPNGNKSFVIKNTGIPDNLPEDIRRKIEALSRMRKTYNATYAEMADFRRSARQVSVQRHDVDFPVVVMQRGINPAAGDDPLGAKKAEIWTKLQNDLTTISPDSKLVTATNSGHHVHIDEPDLLIEAIKLITDKHELQKGK